MIIKPVLRTTDMHGQGHYHASRGNRLHQGVDVAVWPNSQVCAIKRGTVIKLGYPYADDLSYRYVRIQEGTSEVDYFYVEPMVNVGDEIESGDVIGTVQDLEKRYAGITPHIHVQIKVNGHFIDPTDFI